MAIKGSSPDPSPLLQTRVMPEGHPHHYHHHHQLSSVGKSFGNIVISIVGAGVLGLPYTFKHTGWLSSCVVMVAVAFACHFCMMLLVWSRARLEKDGDHPISTFSDLGFVAYGRWGRASVDLTIVLSQGAFCIAYLIFIGENLASVFSNQDDPSASQPRRSPRQLVSAVKELLEQATSLSAFSLSKEEYIWVIFPMQVVLASIRSLTMLAPFSIAADVISGFSMVVVMQQDVSTIVAEGVASPVAYQGLNTIPFAVGVAVYAFEGFGLVLPLESAMKDRKKFGRVLGLAMLCIAVLYTLFGLLGYMAFGEGTLDIITLNLGSNWRTAVVKVGLCFGLFFTFPVMMHPVHEVLERRLLRGRSSIILRTLVVLAAVSCSIAIPNFSAFLSLIGSGVCSILSFVLPPLFHLKANRGELSKSMLIIDYVIIIFGVTFGVWGTVSALENIL